jgi:hypothetical protein
MIENKSLGLFRLMMLVGLVASIYMIRLALIWPSYFTLFALLVLPAPVCFLIVAIKPEVWKKKIMRYYLTGAGPLALAGIAYYLGFVYLHTS